MIQSNLFKLPECNGKSTDEMYTPAWIFKALGVTFDLDVCAPVDGPAHVPCKRWFSSVDDGLAQDWDGVVWCNPPYSKPGPWAERWAGHSDGAFLGPVAKSNWFPRALGSADLVYFPPRALKFIHEGVEAGIPFANFLAVRGSRLTMALARSGLWPLLNPTTPVRLELLS